jgi:hypothetical protein
MTALFYALSLLANVTALCYFATAYNWQYATAIAINAIALNYTGSLVFVCLLFVLIGLPIVV